MMKIMLVIKIKKLFNLMIILIYNKIKKMKF